MSSDQGKYPHIARLIRNRILRGTYTGLLPGEARLAAEFHVSPGTVRTALAYLEGQGFVRRERRKGTFALNPSTDASKHRAAYISLFLLAYEQSMWATSLLDSLRETADAHGLHTLVTDIGRSDVEPTLGADVVPRKGWRSEVLARASEPRTIGSVLLSVPVTVGDAMTLADAHTPVMLVDRTPSEPILPAVLCDNAGAGALAARHLLQLGHRRIAWLQPSEVLLPNHGLRLTAIKETLGRMGLELTAEISGDTRHTLPNKLTTLLKAPERPTAIICDTIALLTAVLSLIRSTNLRVPEDVSVIGMGRSRDTLAPIYPTIVSMGYREMGKRAVELLLDEDALRNPRTEIIPCRLEVGTTTAQPAGA